MNYHETPSKTANRISAKRRRLNLAVPSLFIAAVCGVCTAAAAAICVCTVHAVRAREKAVCTLSARREESVNGEIEVRENLAGVGLTADITVRAVAARQTDIVGRHKQLNVSFEADDGELAERYEQLVAVVRKHKIIPVKARAELLRHFVQGTAAAVAFRFGSNDPGIQHNGVDDLDHCGWTVGVRTKLYVRAVLDIVRGEDPRAALAAEQHDALVEYSETVYNARPTDRTAHLALNAVKEATVHTVQTTIELHRFNVDFHTEQISCTGIAKMCVSGVRGFWGGLRWKGRFLLTSAALWFYGSRFVR